MTASFTTKVNGGLREENGELCVLRDILRELRVKKVCIDHGINQ